MRRRLIPLLAAVLISCVSAVNALSLTEIRTAIRRNVRDTASSTSLQRYTDAMLTAIINEGQRDVVNHTWCIIKSITVTVSALSTTSSVLPTDLLKVRRVTAGGIALPEVTQFQLDADNDDTAWTDDTNQTIFYYTIDRSVTSGSSNVQLGLTVFPAPTVTTTLTVYYYAQAVDLSADADIPFNSLSWLISYDDLLVWYGTRRLLYIEGMTDKAKMFGDLYDTRVDQLYTDYGAKEARVPQVPTKEQKP